MLTGPDGRASGQRQAGAAAKGPASRKRRVSPDGIYENLAAAIFEQRLPPATKLTENTLGVIFGVSRTIIRNVLLRLAHEKLVEIRPNRGAVVASPSPEEARHVFEARRVVEAATVARAAKIITRQQLARMQQLAEEERAAHQRGDRRAWVRLSGAFHLELAEIAGNDVLTDFLGDLVSRTSLVVALNEAPGSSACGLHEHRSVIDAIAAGDAAQAVALMTRHLESCEERLNLAGGKIAVDLHEVFADAAALANLRTKPRRPRRPVRGVDEHDGPAIGERSMVLGTKAKRRRAEM